MTEHTEIDAGKAILQLREAVLALAQMHSLSEPERVKSSLGGAVYTCRQKGIGDELIAGIFNHIFPDVGLPPSS